MLRRRPTGVLLVSGNTAVDVTTPRANLSVTAVVTGNVDGG